MVRRAVEQIPHRPSSSLRVRWVEVELNGADTTIEEALRAVERMRRPVIELPSRPKFIAPSPTPLDGGTATTAPPSDLAPSKRDDEVLQSEAGTTESAPGAAPHFDGPEPLRKKRGTGDRKNRNAGIKADGDIDFVANSKQSLKDFFAQKTPNSDMDKVLVICHFLQYTAQCAKIGPGQVLTAFRHVAKPIPRDLKQTIRNIEKKAWISFNSDIDHVRLTTEGENRVEHQLGKRRGDVGAD
jgi:hypothetical protein